MAEGWKGILPYGERYLFECPQANCYMRVTVGSEAQAIEIQNTHKCPYWGGETKVSWSVTRTLVEQMWDKLDAEMKQIMEYDPAGVSPAKIRARAFAEALAIFMPPFFHTADEIAKEAAKRYKAKQDGDTEYETPGIGHRRYENAAMQHASAAEGWYQTPNDAYSTNPGMAGEPRKQATRTSASPRTVDISKVPEADRVGMKKGYDSGLFTIDQLASTYKVTARVVRAVVGA